MLPVSYNFASIIFSVRFLCFVLSFNSIFSTTEFDFGTLSLTSLKLLGDAHLSNGSVRLTRDVEVPDSGAGRVLYSKPVRFRQPGTHKLCSFSTFFSFSISNLNPSSIGGGLAFVISPDSDFVGAGGGSLGLLDDKGQALGFVAVEFDTLMDVEYKDINGNHVGLDLNSVVSSQAADLGGLDIDLKSGNVINSWIEYDSSFGVLNISISYSNLKPKSPILSLCREGPGAVAGVVTAGAFFLALFAGALIWVYSKKFKHENKLGQSFASEIIKSPKEFTYKELKAATRCFDANRIIGHGAFGTVYKGILPENGDIVAVKRCSHNSQGKNEFLAELLIIGTLRHRNLVRLQGWCHEKGEILLVYDLMPKGSLDKALFEAKTPLPWPERQKILLGVASALAYLHQECDRQVIHRDVKTSNIMLDEAYNAKLGDFGLARQVEHDKSPDATVAAGTMGYLAPEYLLTGRATDKTDVFSYGAVVLEVGSGRRPIETGKAPARVSGNLVEWVWGLHKEGKLLTAADAKLEGRFEESAMRRVLLVGLACSHPDPLARPTMRSVVQMLVGEAEVPMVPRTKPSTSFSTSSSIVNITRQCI
ncbi:hypothetical protein GOBAR_DD11655 [Gossypium barbadense]|nr:hypothetical protein GOBAR_DD11655 [Gossypium barbadense]